MDWKKEYKYLLWIVGGFLAFFYLPVGWPRFDNAIVEGLQLTKWYAREHVLLCLIPAFYIAGAISVFVSQESVLRYLGHKANQVLAYAVAAVSGTILAVCSCTVLPLFAGIYNTGAGLGPATAFLYSGPAINVLAIILTAKVLGPEMGIARAVGAVVFSVVIGLLMHFIFRKDETKRAQGLAEMPVPEAKRRLWQNVVYFGLMVAILIFSNWGKPQGAGQFWQFMYSAKWLLTGFSAIIFGWVLWKWFEIAWWKIAITGAIVAVLSFIFSHEPLIPFGAAVIGLSVITATNKGEAGTWFESAWGYAKQIFPLLLFGVLASGFFLGRPGYEGIIPSAWVAKMVGGNSLGANFFASIVGAFMYFATLTEVPILQGLLGAGMGKGPALALLLAGPALSLPSMLVIRTVIGTKKAAVYIVLVVIMATLTGLLYGWLF
jgi:uncharacterized membrane protein YraQ (UPF0718 family)